jgi:hypothetical protein
VRNELEALANAETYKKEYLGKVRTIAITILYYFIDGLAEK